MKRQSDKLPGAQPRRKYSENFKRKVVKEYEGGFLNKDRLAARYGIKGNDTILKWCRKYGKLPYPRRADAQTGRPMKDPQKQRIKELERALSDALLKIKAYEKLIELTEQQEGVVIKKKRGYAVVRTLHEQEGISLQRLCGALGYSKQAYYQHRADQRQQAAKRQAVRQAVLQWRGRLPQIGGVKLHYLLNQQGCRVGRDALFGLLREEGWLIKKKRKNLRTTDSSGWMRQYPDRLKGLTPSYPEQVWVADITYLMTQAGPVYVHLVSDAYSKRIMGYQVSEDMQASTSVKALRMALSGRQYAHPTIHHSDRGLQYCSQLYTQVLKEHGFLISMTQDGSPYDNAVAERINGILKAEFGLAKCWKMW